MFRFVYHVHKIYHIKLIRLDMYVLITELMLFYTSPKSEVLFYFRCYFISVQSFLGRL